jgi:hypothetical protein
MEWRQISDKDFNNYIRENFHLDDYVILIRDSQGVGYINIYLKYPNDSTYHFKHITLNKYKKYIRTEKLKKLNNYE